MVSSLTVSPADRENHTQKSMYRVDIKLSVTKALDLKMVLDSALLNTQHYKVRTKGKVEQYREWSGALPYTLVW